MFGWLSRRDKAAGAPQTEAAQALIARGNEAEDAGDAASAQALYREAVALAPNLGAAHLNLGIALEAAGDAAGARASYERAFALEPANAAASYNLGKLLYAQGLAAEAEQRLAHALALREDFPEARIVRGYALHALGRLEEAEADLRAGLERRADLHARARLFHVLEARGDSAAALVELEAMLEARPDWTEALYNYATTLMVLRRDDEAEAALRRVLRQDPAFALAYRMLASLLHRQGRIADALEVCATGRKALPQNLELESLELFTLNFSDRVTDDALFERHVEFGRRLEALVPARFAGVRSAKRPLRIGYVSPDLSYHPVGLFLLPVLECHDRPHFEPYCYATGTQADDFTRRLRAAAAGWREAHALDDRALAELIHADGIDILVDLAGHSGACRLGVFAQKPAPVQAAWLGYLNTSGLTRIDYRITDRHCDPVGASEARHTESLVRLPHSQWCYRPFVDAAATARAPRESNGHVTFGSFTQTAKLTPTTLAIWGRIFQALPGARLVVAGVAPGAAAERLRAALGCAGIAPARLELAPFLPVQHYLQLFGKVDIALDPVPYSGGTSSCDALWMGVPVLTLPGRRAASRSAASLLSVLGLDGWIASDADDYVRRAVHFADDPGLIGELRRSLRSRMRASPLTDDRSFTRALEEAFAWMWDRFSERSA